MLTVRSSQVTLDRVNYAVFLTRSVSSLNTIEVAPVSVMESDKIAIIPIQKATSKL